jgi:hypothetical protein
MTVHVPTKRTQFAGNTAQGEWARPAMPLGALFPCAPRNHSDEILDTASLETVVSRALVAALSWAGMPLR